MTILPSASHRLTAFDRQPRSPEEAAALMAGGCLPCEIQAAASDPEAFAVPETAGPRVGWEGPLAFEGQMTGDGRFIEPNALTWDTLPMTVRITFEDTGGHQGAYAVGRILTIERREGGVIWGTGDFDLGGEHGAEAARLVREEIKNGVSVDLDSVSFEIRVAREILEGIQEQMDEGPADAAEDSPEDEEGRVTVARISADDEVMVLTGARIRAVTQVDTPAFEGARINLSGEPTGEVGEAGAGESEDSLVAGGYPVRPPAAWFSDPGLSEPTGLTVTSEGRIFGHLAVWGTCHTAYTGQCVTPPFSATDYAHFRLGTVLSEEGAEIPVGRITLDTLHARPNLSATATAAHYEDTGRAVADVAVGEDEVGIWVAGSLRPGVTEEQVRALRASPLSGDWRRIGANLELVAALAVNVPGFPIPRPQGLVASGAMTSLVAAGMLAPRTVPAPGSPGALSPEDLRYLKALAARERESERARREDLAHRSRVASHRFIVNRTASRLGL